MSTEFFYQGKSNFFAYDLSPLLKFNASVALDKTSNAFVTLFGPDQRCGNSGANACIANATGIYPWGFSNLLHVM